MNDKNFIKEFKKISIKNICKQNDINYYNIIGGRAGYEATKKVVEILSNELQTLIDKKKASISLKIEEN